VSAAEAELEGGLLLFCEGDEAGALDGGVWCRGGPLQAFAPGVQTRAAHAVLGRVRRAREAAAGPGFDMLTTGFEREAKRRAAR
jgi:hypothetical protein